jgi:hypothetical protein
MERSDLFAWLTTHGVRIVAILAFAILATRLARLAVRRRESRLEGSAELTLEQSLQRRATLGKRLSLRSTWLRTFDGTLHVVPNGTIMFIGNRSRGWAQAIVDVSLPVDTDPETAR